MKTSKSEKQRRKESEIYGYFDDLLIDLLHGYKEDDERKIRESQIRIQAFIMGCYLSDDRKWKDRLNIRLSICLEDNISTIDAYWKRKGVE